MRHTAPKTSRDPRLNAEIDTILAARHSDPFALLGPHTVGGHWTVRFFLPWAAGACISLTPQAIEGGTLAAAKASSRRLGPPSNPLRPPQAVTRFKGEPTPAIPSKSSTPTPFPSCSASLICI